MREFRKMDNLLISYENFSIPPSPLQPHRKKESLKPEFFIKIKTHQNKLLKCQESSLLLCDTSFALL